MKNTLALVLLLLAISLQPLMAQVAPSNAEAKIDKRGIRNVYWAEAGFGMSNEGWVGGASISLETVKNILLLGGISNLDKGGLVPESSYFERQSRFIGLGYVNKAGESLKILSLSYSSSDFTQAVFSGQFSSSGVPEHDFNFRTVGGVRLDFRIIPNNGWAGLSFNPFVDINGVQSIVGAKINIALGRMW
jgi:hypothetical protein